MPILDKNNKKMVKKYYNFLKKDVKLLKDIPIYIV